jgi:predicted nucleic acid-binding protein
VIVVDTSALIDSLCGTRRSLDKLTELVEAGERLVLPAIALYEWLRGPRLPDELHAQEEIFPREDVAVFGAAEAAIAADLYRLVRSPRGREIDLAIAATARVRDASLWTLNTQDFADIPKLRLV